MRNYLAWSDEQRAEIVGKVYDELLLTVLEGRDTSLGEILERSGIDGQPISWQLWYKWLAQPWAKEIAEQYRVKIRTLTESDVSRDWPLVVRHLAQIAKGNLGDVRDHIQAARTLATLFPELTSDQRRELSNSGRAAVLIEKFVVGTVQVAPRDEGAEAGTVIEGVAKVIA